MADEVRSHVTGVAANAEAYVRELEEHLRLAVFGETGAPGADAAVLLVRVALARGDRPRAKELAGATSALAVDRPAIVDIEAAAAHALGLVEADTTALEYAASAYIGPQSRAQATEDTGQTYAMLGDGAMAVMRLREAYERYEQLGCAAGMARIRCWLRRSGVRMRHWHRSDRPAFGWDSLTDTERRVAGLVAQGLSNREAAAEMFLSAHTIAFHLRHIFWKLGVGSRVQLARLAAEGLAVAPDLVTTAGTPRPLAQQRLTPDGRLAGRVKRMRGTWLLPSGSSGRTEGTHEIWH